MAARVISKLYYNSQYNGKLMQNWKKVERLGMCSYPWTNLNARDFLVSFIFKMMKGFQDGILTCIILKADWGTTAS